MSISPSARNRMNNNDFNTKLTEFRKRFVRFGWQAKKRYVEKRYSSRAFQLKAPLRNLSPPISLWLTRFRGDSTEQRAKTVRPVNTASRESH